MRNPESVTLTSHCEKLNICSCEHEKSRWAGVQVTEPTERAFLAEELDVILTQMVSLANTEDESGYLFAGTATETEPFTLDASKSSGTVTYHGSSDSSFLRISGDVERETLIAGDEIFQTIIREPTIILGDTGLRSGLGTDTAVGNGKLTVAHTNTDLRSRFRCGCRGQFGGG